MKPLRAGVLTCMLLSGCMGPDDAAAEACLPGALGVARTLTLTPDSPPVSAQLVPGEVVLTFDDGPEPGRTRAVLDALSAECTRATFFMLGGQAEASPGLVREVARRGHAIGGHSYDHTNFTTLPLAGAMKNMKRGNTAISDALGGQAVSLFRFPYVALNQTLWGAMQESKTIVVGVDVDGADWTDISNTESVDLIMSRLGQNDRKGVILLHDPFPKSDERLKLLISRLKSEHYRVVALAPDANVIN
ncbi:polysaccharide deacetylase family protein [Hyphomonas johnsonii]|uniref:Chitooligosaccharide deacetylase n=1 Tax=Hyphomonas johnsonii MHS-2 TaxID=1280950 RepID=A0A059FUZ8_9PROT|nr:polysaccharide deacetylase family protein [Hyphomonas johnsonii]KCZ94484.1 polysaccharide deacetylase [Hyphomonas johnsonii MHS-2]